MISAQQQPLCWESVQSLQTREIQRMMWVAHSGIPSHTEICLHLHPKQEMLWYCMNPQNLVWSNGLTAHNSQQPFLSFPPQEIYNLSYL